MFESSVLDDLQQRIQALERDRDLLKQRVDVRDKEAARTQLDALEKSARIQELEGELQKRENELEENRERLQRLDTRVKALTGPAQAASAIAEAEAAYQVAVAEGKIDPTKESAQNIRSLLENGTKAFEAEDYAAAADLGDQVIRTLSADDTKRLSGDVPSVKYPEMAMLNPVAFRVRVNSNVRGGPGMIFTPHASLPPGAQVTGLATRGHWVKIRGPDDIQGWIYRKLLAVPE